MGDVEPISVHTTAEFPMIVPAGKAGTGDPKHPDMAFNHDEETDEWDFVGPGYEEAGSVDGDC